MFTFEIFVAFLKCFLLKILSKLHNEKNIHHIPDLNSYYMTQSEVFAKPV